MRTPYHLALIVAILFLTACGTRKGMCIHYGEGILNDQSFTIAVVMVNGQASALYSRGIYAMMNDDNTWSWVPAETSDDGNWLVLIGCPGKALLLKMSLDVQDRKLVPFDDVQTENGQ